VKSNGAGACARAYNALLVDLEGVSFLFAPSNFPSLIGTMAASGCPKYNDFVGTIVNAVETAMKTAQKPPEVSFNFLIQKVMLRSTEKRLRPSLSDYIGEAH
jgi:hypothetical protein